MKVFRVGVICIKRHECGKPGSYQRAKKYISSHPEHRERQIRFVRTLLAMVRNSQ